MLQKICIKSQVPFIKKSMVSLMQLIENSTPQGKNEIQTKLSLTEKSTEFFRFFFHLKVSILEHCFCKRRFLITSIFKTFYFLK